MYLETAIFREFLVNGVNIWLHKIACFKVKLSWIRGSFFVFFSIFPLILSGGGGVLSFDKNDPGLKMHFMSLLTNVFFYQYPPHPAWGGGGGGSCWFDSSVIVSIQFFPMKF